MEWDPSCAILSHHLPSSFLQTKRGNIFPLHSTPFHQSKQTLRFNTFIKEMKGGRGEKSLEFRSSNSISKVRESMHILCTVNFVLSIWYYRSKMDLQIHCVSKLIACVYWKLTCTDLSMVTRVEDLCIFACG